MPIADIEDTVRVQGLPRNGVSVSLYPASSFGSPPAQDTALPGSGLIATVTTGTTYGAAGKYRFTDLAPGEYYAGAVIGSNILWQYHQVPPPEYAVVMVLMAGHTPGATGADANEAIVPYDPRDGTSSITWNVRRIDFRVATAGGAPAVTVEKYTGTGAFSATTVGTVTLGSGDSQGAKTSAFTTSTLASGDKVRVNVGTLGSALGWHVSLTLEAQ